jgi:hypothetical protein
MIDDILSDLVLALGGGVVEEVVQGRRERKARVDGRVRGAARRADGEVPGTDERPQTPKQSRRDAR